MSGLFVFFCKPKTAYEMRISDWSSDVCSSDLLVVARHLTREPRELARLVIIFGLGLQPPRDVARRIIGRRRLEPVSGVGFGNARRTIDDQGRFDLRFQIGRAHV